MRKNVQVTDEELTRVKTQFVYILDCVEREMLREMAAYNQTPTPAYWVGIQFLTGTYHETFCQMMWDGILGKQYEDDDEMAALCSASVRKYLTSQIIFNQVNEVQVTLAVGMRKDGQSS